jgi:hypothetical protein
VAVYAGRGSHVKLHYCMGTCVNASLGGAGTTAPGNATAGSTLRVAYATLMACNRDRPTILGTSAQPHLASCGRGPADTFDIRDLYAGPAAMGEAVAAIADLLGNPLPKGLLEASQLPTQTFQRFMYPTAASGIPLAVHRGLGYTL